jgi:hypothetical protein
MGLNQLQMGAKDLMNQSVYFVKRKGVILPNGGFSFVAAWRILIG